MKKRVMILSNHFITLYNFRKELITRLVSEGHELYLSLPASKDNKYFRDLGCQIIETDIDRRGINPLKDLKLLAQYIKLVKKYNPDIIFSYTIKPNIYGSIATNLLKVKQISNITGTGGTFLKENYISKIVKILYKLSMKKSYKVFFQNKGDRDFFIKNNMIGTNYSLLPGSGVNLEQYTYSEMPIDKEINFIFIGRVMEIKGIKEYLEAAKTIKKRYNNTNFYVAGFIEEEKYKKIIEDYDKNGYIKYIGFQNNIIDWIERCHCTVLPSYGGEGVPNVLLETAAVGRACIASNINGSEDVVEDSINGYLFDPGNVIQLAEKITSFINLNYEDKLRMGKLGRKKVEEQFDRKLVIDAYLNELNN